MEKEVIVCNEKCDECLFSGACELEEVKKLEGYLKMYYEYLEEVTNQMKNPLIANDKKIQRYKGTLYYAIRSTLNELKEYDEEIRGLSNEEIETKLNTCNEGIKKYLCNNDDELAEAFEMLVKQMRR